MDVGGKERGREWREEGEEEDMLIRGDGWEVGGVKDEGEKE